MLFTGDRIVCLTNDRRIGVTNGTRGTITRRDRTGTITFVPDGREAPITLDADYTGRGTVALGYATTVRRPRA